MTTLNSDERNLILVQGLYFFGDALAGVFVTIYIFAHSDFQTVIWYTFLNFLFLLVWFVFSGRIMEKVASGTLVRVGLLFNALYYFFLFILRDASIHYLLPLAFLDGTAAGLFWAGLNLNQYVFTKQHSRVQYFALQSAVSNGFRGIGPIIGGSLIAILGSTIFYGINLAYTILFFVTSLVYFFAVVFIGKLPEHARLHFSFRKFVSHRRSFSWNMVLWQHAAFGCFDVLLGTMMGILIYTVVKKEFFLGGAQTAIACAAAVGAVAASRILKARNTAYWIGSIGVALGIVGFGIAPNIWGLWFFIVVYGCTSTFLTTWLLTIWFHTLDREMVDWRENYHVLIEREIALDIPRMLSYLLLFAGMQFGDQVQLAWTWLYVLPVFPLILGILFTIHTKHESEILPDIGTEE